MLGPMRALTLPRYLLGSRDAILEVASSRWSILIGILFVISAGLAREYDGENLLHEPWHALRPLGASLVSGTTLFLLVHLVAWMKSGKSESNPPGFFVSWMRFMGVFWMTAPMAWLYAIPYERWTSPVDAIKLNLWTLAIVALWRVVLMVRVIQVIYGIKGIFAFFLVMIFSDAVVFTVITTVPTPVIDVMGGIRQSERDALLASVTFSVTILSILTAPVWIIGALVSIGMLRPNWPSLPNTSIQAKPIGLLAIAVVSILAFIPLLVIAQPEQLKKHKTEQLFMKGDIDDALALMSQYEPSDYPPHWNPPPRIGYRESVPSLDHVRDAMTKNWPADWVAKVYLEKIDRELRYQLMPYWTNASWTDIAEQLLNPETNQTIEPEEHKTAEFLYDHLHSLSDEEKTALARIARPSESDKDVP